jgi:hypothetical protein
MNNYQLDLRFRRQWLYSGMWRREVYSKFIDVSKECMPPCSGLKVMQDSPVQLSRLPLPPICPLMPLFSRLLPSVRFCNTNYHPRLPCSFFAASFQDYIKTRFSNRSALFLLVACLGPEDRHSTSLVTVAELLTDYTVSQPRRFNISDHSCIRYQLWSLFVPQAFVWSA